LIEKQPVSIRQKIVKSNKCSLTGKIAWGQKCPS
jgi:hypothetical protein